MTDERASTDFYMPDKAGCAVEWDFEGTPQINDFAEQIGDLFGWYMCVLPVKIKTRTSLGLIVPDTILERYEGDVTLCRVVGIGELSYAHREFTGATKLPKIGDYILIRKFCGQELPLVADDGSDVRCRVLSDKELFMIVKNPARVRCFS